MIIDTFLNKIRKECLEQINGLVVVKYNIYSPKESFEERFVNFDEINVLMITSSGLSLRQPMKFFGTTYREKYWILRISYLLSYNESLDSEIRFHSNLETIADIINSNSILPNVLNVVGDINFVIEYALFNNNLVHSAKSDMTIKVLNEQERIIDGEA